MTSKIVEIIAIGREILDGRVIDTNSVVIAEMIRELGLTPRYAQKVDDDVARIIESFKIAQNRSDVILVTGGLGPTSDDLTAQTFGEFLGEKTVLNSIALEQVEQFFKKISRQMIEVQKKQAWIPPSCFVLENKVGSAPGFALEQNGKAWYFMPGVPKEMSHMLRDQILPRLPRQKVSSMTWSTQFTSEGKLQEQLNAVEKKLVAGFEMTYRTRFPENHICLYADVSDTKNIPLFESLCVEVSDALGKDVFFTARDQQLLQCLEEVVVDKLLKNHQMLGTVESCTGGFIAHRITNIAGASKVFVGSIVSYDNAVKEKLLDISGDVIQKHGAVSPEVARLLAEQGLKRLGSTLCVSTTGIAGPTGGSETKPVGLCFIALAFSSGKPTIVEEIRGRFGLEREYYKTFFAQKALDLVRRNLD